MSINTILNKTLVISPKGGIPPAVISDLTSFTTTKAPTALILPLSSTSICDSIDANSAMLVGLEPGIVYGLFFARSFICLEARCGIDLNKVYDCRVF